MVPGRSSEDGVVLVALALGVVLLLVALAPNALESVADRTINRHRP